MRMRCGVFAVVAAALSVCPTSRAQTRPGGGETVIIAVDQEPRHRVVFADADLRVLLVRIPAGDESLMHRHDRDLLTVNIENGPTRTRGPAEDWSAVRPRTIGGVNVNEYTGRPSAHIVQSVGDRPYRLVGVENMKAGGWTSLPAVASAGLVVEAENRAFRAYQVRLQAGESSGHTHAVPVVVTLVEGTVVAMPGGAVRLAAAGDWALVPAGVTHQVAAERPSWLVEVEVR